MPPFVASPALADHRLQVDANLRPAYNVLALTELVGSPYILSGDGKGCVSAWNVEPGRRGEEPDQYFEAHTGSISQVLLLQSNLLPELIEESEWPEDDEKVARASWRRASDGEALKAKGPRASRKGHHARPKGGFLQRLRFWRRASHRRGDGKHWLVVTSAEDGAVRFWRWRLKHHRKRKGSEIAPFEVDFITEWNPDPEHPVPVTGCLELHDGNVALMLSESSDIKILDPAAGVVRWVLFGHTGPLTALAQCVDGRLVSGGADGTVRLWGKRAWESKRDKRADIEGDQRPAPMLVWGEPGQEAAIAGVSSMAFFAHMQQAQKGECVALCVRVFVQRAENLPKPDLFAISDNYVTCTVFEGSPAEPGVCTPKSKLPVWNHRCVVSLRRTCVGDKWEIPECAFLDFEVRDESKSSKDDASSGLVGHWTVPLDDVFLEMSFNAGVATPKKRKLYAPLGKGPYEDLKAAMLLVGFEQNDERTVDCLVASAEGLPPGIRGSTYVRVVLRQTMAGKPRRVPTKYRDKTRSRDDDIFWNDILELEVPVCLADQKMTCGPDIYLHFEVYDHHMVTSDELLGTLTLPLSQVLEADSGEVRPYDIALAPGMEKNMKQPKRQSRDRGADQPADAPRPNLFLAFQAIVPCPMQLRCTVERAHALPISQSGNTGPVVRMRFVEGNPLLAQLTAVRTASKMQTLNPVWHERCVLPVPGWIRRTVDPSILRAASVRAGWEHERVDERLDIVICVDIYDHDRIGIDDLLGNCSIPLAAAEQAALDGSGSAVQPFHLTSSPNALVWLGFEPGPQPETIVVIVDRAENLPSGDVTGLSDPYCKVRIAELGTFGEPTDRTNFPCISSAETAPASAGTRDPVWRHDELLDLPGGDIGGVVAARANWHLLFELVDTDERSEEEVMLGQTAVPLTDVLSDLYTKENPDMKPVPMRTPKNAIAVPGDPGQGKALFRVTRDLPVVVFEKGGRRSAGTAETSTPKRSISGKVGRTLTAALGAGRSEEAQAAKSGAEGEEQPILLVRFEAVPRWTRIGRTMKSPPTKKMTRLSPVTCLVTLVSTLVAGHENGNIFVWDSTGGSGVPLHHIQAHRVAISAMAVIPSIDCIVTTGCVRTLEEAASDSLLRVWSCATLELRQTLSLHGGNARALRPLDFGGGRKGTSCLALGTDTRQSRLLQLLKLDAA